MVYHSHRLLHEINFMGYENVVKRSWKLYENFHGQLKIHRSQGFHEPWFLQPIKTPWKSGSIFMASSFDAMKMPLNDFSWAVKFDGIFMCF